MVEIDFVGNGDVVESLVVVGGRRVERRTENAKVKGTHHWIFQMFRNQGVMRMKNPFYGY